MTASTPISIHRSRRLVSIAAAGAVLAVWVGAAAERASAATATVLGTTLFVTGDNTDDRIALRLEAGVPTNLQVDLNDDGVPEATVDRATFDRININGRRGDDRIRMDEANGVFTDTEITTFNGGRGNDTMNGGRGVETFFGGPGDDEIDGNAGNDVAFMGADDDLFIWDPGDGSDVVEGQRGDDTMEFRGSNGNENFDVSANGSRVRFFRDLGSITMDTNSVEEIELYTLGGTDVATINPTRGTALRSVEVDLAAVVDGDTGDGGQDTVVVNATPRNDDITIKPKRGSVLVEGLTPLVSIEHAEAANDTLTVNALGGDDNVRLRSGLSALIKTLVSA